jgi:hypothetical protein
MAHHGSSIVALSTHWSVLRSCTYLHRNRTRVSAFLLQRYFSVRGALFLTPIAVNSGMRSRLCFPSYVSSEVIYGNQE